MTRIRTRWVRLKCKARAISDFSTNILRGLTRFKNLLLQGALVASGPTGESPLSGHAIFIACLPPTDFRTGAEATN